MKVFPTHSRLAIPLLTGVFLAGCNCPLLRQPPLAQASETAPQDYTELSPQVLALKEGVPVDFRRQVKPILQSKCLPCHSGQSAASGPLQPFSMTRESILSRIVPGKPEQSPLLILTHTAAHQQAVMPPVGNRLTAQESRILEQWIKEGAAWPEGRTGRL